MKTNSKYTAGPVRSTMLKTALAMLAGTLAMSGYNLADTYFVGQLPGEIPLAAMGFTLPVIMLIGCIFRGVNIGVMTTLAHALGAQKHNKAAKLVTYGIFLIALISCLIGAAGVLSGNAVLSLFGARGEALTLAKDYMDIWYYGCLTASLSMAGNDILIVTGDNKMASVMMIAGMVINVILDPLFIFGWGPVPAMGIKGAALATVIAQLISAILVWQVVSRRHKLLCFNHIDQRGLRHAWALMIHYAIPAAIGMLLMPVGSAVVTRITASFGNAAVAGVAAAGRLEMVAFVVPMALGISLTPMIAQNYGAKQFDRIEECRRFAMRFAAFFLTIMAIVFTVFSGWISRQFSTDLEVQQIMALALKIIPWGLAGVEIHRFAGFFYNGCGRPRTAAVINAMRIVVFLIPFSLVALYFKSLPGLLFARLLADFGSGIIGYLLARHFTKNLLVRSGKSL